MMASIAKVTIDRARATQSLRMANGLVSQWLSVGEFRSCFCVASQSVPSAWIIEGRLPNGDNVQLASYETDLFDPANPRYVTMKAMCGLPIRGDSNSRLVNSSSAYGQATEALFERIIQYLIVTFGANDQATDESLIINQLWNDHPEMISFLPPDFNISMLQTPEWATNPVMQSFVYHFIGPSKPHLDRCCWQRSNPLELSFPDNRQSIELIREWEGNPPASYDIGSIFRPDLAANLLAVYPNLIVSGTWSDELTVYDERLTSLDETFSSHLVLTRFLIRLGVNARRFKLRIKEGDDATLQIARS